MESTRKGWQTLERRNTGNPNLENRRKTLLARDRWRGRWEQPNGVCNFPLPACRAGTPVVVNGNSISVECDL